MFEDSQKLIFSTIVSHWAIEGTVNFLKNGKISVKFHNEKKRIQFHKLIDIIEILENYDEKNPLIKQVTKDEIKIKIFNSGVRGDFSG